MHANLGIKRDLPVSWNLIVILPNHPERLGITWEAQRSRQLSVFNVPYKLRRRQTTNSWVGEFLLGRGYLIPKCSGWFRRITIKLQLTVSLVKSLNSTSWSSRKYTKPFQVLSSICVQREKSKLSGKKLIFLPRNEKKDEKLGGRLITFSTLDRGMSVGTTMSKRNQVATAKLKIRHLFGNTIWWRASPSEL